MGGRCWWLSKAHMHISQWESFPHRLGGFLRYFDCEHVDVPVEGWAVEDTHVMRLTQRPWMSRVGTTSLGVDQNKCEDIPKLGPLNPSYPLPFRHTHVVFVIKRHWIPILRSDGNQPTKYANESIAWLLYRTFVWMWFLMLPVLCSIPNNFLVDPGGPWSKTNCPNKSTQIARLWVAKIPTRRRCLWNVWCTGVLVWRCHRCVGQDQPFWLVPFRRFFGWFMGPLWVAMYTCYISLFTTVYTCRIYVFRAIYTQMAIFGRLVLSREFFRGDVCEFSFLYKWWRIMKQANLRWQLCQVSWRAIWPVIV